MNKKILHGLIGALIGVLAMVLTVLMAYDQASGSSSSGSSAASSNSIVITNETDNVAIQTNGDITVTRDVDYKLNRNGSQYHHQLFFDIPLNSSAATAVTNVSVTDLSTGQQLPQAGTVISNGNEGKSSWDAAHANTFYVADISYGTAGATDYDADADALSVGDAVSETGELNAQKTVEIGWNLEAVKSGSVRYRIQYTLKDAVTRFGDVAKARLQLYTEDGGNLPVKSLQATVTFPGAVSESNSWGWLHTTAESTTNRTGSDTFAVTAKNISSDDGANIVVLYPTAYASGAARTSSRAVKDSTISTENAYESQWNAQVTSEARGQVALWLALAIIGLALAVWSVWSSLRLVKESEVRDRSGYWREPPAMSPAAASLLYFAVTGTAVAGSQRSVNRESGAQLSATAMSLVTKGAIAVYPGRAAIYRGINLADPNIPALAAMVANVERSGDRNAGIDTTSTVVVLPAAYGNPAALGLCASEQALLQIFTQAALRLGGPVFDLEQLQSLIRQDRSLIALFQGFQTAANNELLATGAVRKGRVWRILGFGLAAAVAIVVAMWVAQGSNLAFALIWGLLVLGSLGFALGSCPRVTLTDPRGQFIASRVDGLARYLEDFSDFSDRGPLDLTLWGRYLVYATAFGLSDKALAQLMAAYPQMADPNWADTYASRHPLVYWSSRSARYHRMYGGPAANGAPGMAGFSGMGGFSDLGTQLADSFSSIGSTISAATGSSHSGVSGGSFSGGSGFKGGADHLGPRAGGR